MGLFTLRQTKLSRAEDPLEPFTMPDFSSLEPSRGGFDFKKITHGLYSYRYAILILIGLVGVWGWMAGRDERKDPFVFIELRALDPSGHPVAGARVDFGGMVKGVTDSFGEWRRYLRLEPGAQVIVRLQKETRQGKLVATKTFDVPATLPKSREPEIKSSIQLAVGKPGAQKTAEHLEVPEPAAPAVIASVSVPGGVYGRVALTLKMPSAGDLSDTAEKERLQLEKTIYPLLKRKFEAQGVSLDPVSPWQVALQYVPLPEGKGFVRAEVRTRHGGEGLAFLRQLAARPEDSADALLDLVRHHTPVRYSVEKKDGSWYVTNMDKLPKFWQLEGGKILKDQGGQTFPLSREVYSKEHIRLRLITAGESPCQGGAAQCSMKAPTVVDTPPINGWRLLKFKLEGGNKPANTDIFMSGYQVRSGPEGFLYYWGEPLTGANLTMVRSGRVTFRQRIQDQTASVPVVRVASEPIARR